MTQKADPVPNVVVKTVSVAQQTIRRTTQQPATIHANFETAIHARATGYVRELSVDIGDVVQVDDVLAVIDVPEMQMQRQVIEARIVRLEAEEDRARAGVDLAMAGVTSAEAQLAESKSQLARVEAMLVAAEAEFVRTKDLVDRKSLEQRMLDEARKKRDSEMAGMKAAQSMIESAAAAVIVAKAKRSSAESDLVAAKSETTITRRQLDELDVLINYATLRAPFDGIITARGVEPGDLVDKDNSHSKAPLFVISQVDKLRVRVPVPESDAPFVQVGDSVDISFPSFESQPVNQVTVSRISGSLDPSTRTMVIEADLPNGEGKFLPGMFGQATINLSTSVATNVLPARAIRFSEDGDAFVYLIDESNSVTIQSISTGLDDGHQIEIRDGLMAGQTVIDAHLERFSDGQTVAVLPQ